MVSPSMLSQFRIVSLAAKIIEFRGVFLGRHPRETENLQNFMADRPTDGRTEGRMNGRTDGWDSEKHEIYTHKDLRITEKHEIYTRK